MSDTIINFLQQYNIPGEAIVFIISLLPILELRGGLIASAILRLPLIKAFLICFIANVLPMPFILIFIQAIFKFLKGFSFTKPLIEWLEKKAVSKSSSISKKYLLGLFLFVAIPLPGTGGWTGALIASVLEMPIKKSFVAIVSGIFCAGLIMIAITYFIPGLFGFKF
ncbi:MAG: small multi-drug export protein [Clostridiales bacterium]|jgi:uncharacterized membrane protein|nr:small multi-drug export protein [Clostridiales bacterium]